MHVWVQNSPLDEDTSHVRSGPTLMTSSLIVSATTLRPKSHSELLGVRS